MRNCLFRLLAAGTLLSGFPPDVVHAAVVPAEVGFPTQVQPGNIFTVGEKVEVRVAIQNGSEIKWTCE